MSQFGNLLLNPNDIRTQRCTEVLARLSAVVVVRRMVWQVHVINDEYPKAFIMPGGYIFITTGMLNTIALNDDGIATILAHELAHHTLGHATEPHTISQFFKTLGYLAWSMSGLPVDTSTILRNFPLQLSSHLREYLADHLGLLYMAKACYHPEEALEVLERLIRWERGQPQTETHPDPRDRLGGLRRRLPEALARRAMAGCSPKAMRVNFFQ